MTGRSPTAQRRRLGRLLRKLREQAGVSGDEAGTAVERSASWISRIESGQAGLRQRELRDLLSVYQLHDPDERAELERLAEAGRERGWWSSYADVMSKSFYRYVGLEADATSISCFEDRVIPGLLQTRRYMDSLYDLMVPEPESAEREARIRIRTKRQEILQAPDAPRFFSIIDEAVLRREIGDPEVAREQLARLLDIIDDGTIGVQILSFTNRVMAIHGFAILHFEADPPAAYVDTLSGGIFEEGDSTDRFYVPIFEHLKRVALDHRGSRQAIASAMKELA